MRVKTYERGFPVGRMEVLALARLTPLLRLLFVLPAFLVCLLLRLARWLGRRTGGCSCTTT